MITIVLAALALASGTILMWSVRGLPSAGPEQPTRIAVVVPARDEEARLPRLLASIAAQTVRPEQVIVVDDSSSDATSALAHASGARVITSDGPPPGWTGKTWACQVGVAAATSDGDPDLMVVLDADVWLAPDALARLAAAHSAVAPDGLVSVQPFHVTRRAYEQLSAVPNIVAVMASGLAAVRPPRVSRVAFGPCLVTTPETLAAVGGFAAVRGEVIEDIALARRFREQGRPVQCYAGRETVRFRMYEHGLAPLVEGWTKNLAGGAARAALLPTLGAVVWVVGAAAVAASAVVDPNAVDGVLWGVLAMQTWWMLRRLGRFHAWTAVVFAVPVACFVAIFAVSIFRRTVLRSVSWSGRSIPVSPR